MTRPIGPALAAAAALLLAAGAPALADTVVLRDGRVLTGRVIEQGDKIYIEVRDLGGTIVSRQDVLRIETAEGTVRPAVVQDELHLRDGRIVRGDVRVSPDGTEVIVGLGDRGEVRVPRSAVGVIRWRDGRADAGEVAGMDEHARRLNETIDRRVRELAHGTDVERLEARRELLALGGFSRAYLETVAQREPDALRPILRDLDRLEAIRKVLPSKAEEALPRLGERLVSPEASERESALRSVVMEVPEQVGPLLLHVIKIDEAPRVRAYCVSQLAALRRYEELAEVLRLPDGPLRLTAAFALGDAGILAGVPILIEALRLSDPEIRAVAIQKLTEYTGQHFGYRAQGSQEDRDRAVARWNQWWNENGKDIVRQSLITQIPGLGLTTAEESDRARALWDEANRLIGSTLPRGRGAAEAAPSAEERQRKLDRAQDLLRQALDLDASLSGARMTRAVLLYEELGRPRDAERQLNLIVSRAEHDSKSNPDSAKKYANFHLGTIALREGSFERATVRFTQALQYDPQFLEGLVALGDTHLGVALSAVEAGGAPTVEGRKEALQAARRAFGDALAAIERQEAELRGVTRDLMAEAPDTLAEGQVVQAVSKSLNELKRRKAEVHFRIGRACAALMEDEAALAAYRAASTLVPDDETYREALRAWTPRPPEPAPARPASAPGPGAAPR
ncbi:MAG: hypothetical protein M9894_02205 [Planctomycetes bacterium]|nr:hypothetical protein [Planctomycetota bacterium]